MQACLSERRQYVQTRGKNACEGTNLAWFTPNLISILPLARSFFHRILEDSQEFAHPAGYLTVCTVAEEEQPDEDATAEIKAAYNWKIVVLTWYLDIWLPMVVGVDFFGPSIRPCALMVDKFKDPNDGNKEKVCVTVTSEAYDLIQLENSRDKWAAVCAYKDEKGWKKTLPSHNEKKPATHQFKSKWSDAKSGQQCCWDPVDFAAFKQRKASIKKIRGEQAEKDNGSFKFCQNLIKEARELEEEGQKRPAKRARLEVEVVEIDLDFEDE